MKAENIDLIIAIDGYVEHYVVEKAQDKRRENLYGQLSELEAKAAKWDDPQTQADLKLAQIVRLAFEHGLSIAEWVTGTSNEYRHIADNEIDLLKWADKL